MKYVVGCFAITLGFLAPAQVHADEMRPTTMRLASEPSAASSVLHGHVRNSNRQGLALMTVFALNTQRMSVAQARTDGAGYFRLVVRARTDTRPKTLGQPAELGKQRTLTAQSARPVSTIKPDQVYLRIVDGNNRLVFEDSQPVSILPGQMVSREILVRGR